MSHHRQIYPQLLDPVYTDEADREKAMATHRAQLLLPDPTRLDTTNAVSSHVILSADCARDENYLTLVEKGAIQFFKWPDGKHGRTALQSVMTDMKYRFSGWGCEINDENDGPEIRRLALERYDRGDGIDTFVPAVNQLIDGARALFPVIQRADVTEKARLRGTTFAAGLARAHRWLDLHDETGLAARELCRLANQLTADDKAWRARVFSYLDGQQQYGRSAIHAAKDALAIEYNIGFAEALKVRPFFGGRHPQTLVARGQFGDKGNTAIGRGPAGSTTRVPRITGGVEEHREGV
ncbi:MAG: hypothetical protein IH988_00420 [Planctomycetes bacterium]|nr:hypothetical protein [Planctomycetota bacterium]